MLTDLYTTYTGHAPANETKLSAAGSNRRYTRYTAPDGSTLIGAYGANVDENRTFCRLARHFGSMGLPVPEIYALSDDGHCYLQEDLGSYSLYDALRPSREGGNYDKAAETLLTRTIRLLPHLQVNGARGLDFDDICLPPQSFDRQAAMFDLNYFKYSYLKTTDLPFDEVRLEADLQNFAADLAGDGTQAGASTEADGTEQLATFLYRDFQARNVMLRHGDKPFFIDFQGGRRGPLHYDLASFLYQASAHYPQSLRERLLTAYLDELSSLVPDLRPEAFRKKLTRFILFRMMQVLGAYGLRGLFEHKPYFLKSIPPALHTIRELVTLRHAAEPYPYLAHVLTEMASLTQTATAVTTTAPAAAPATIPDSATHAHPSLVVRVYSFSYKKGIPDDPSGNGGGYVFDCRGVHNPGRYDRYKPLTGLDRPVIDFLEADGEILSFLDSVYALADAHTARYIERGFTSLMFSFGCTGGRHRSVYSAEHLARHLNERFGIEVRINHIEQGIARTLPPRS